MYKVYGEAYTKCTKFTVERVYKVYKVYDEAYTKFTKLTMGKVYGGESVQSVR